MNSFLLEKSCSTIDQLCSAVQTELYDAKANRLIQHYCTFYIFTGLMYKKVLNKKQAFLQTFTSFL